MDKSDAIETRTVTDVDRERIRAAVDAFAAGHEWIAAVYLYGSAASSERPARDIDIGVLTTGVSVVFEAASDLAAALSDGTGIRGIPFDVRIVDGADPVFLNNLLSAGSRLFSRDSTRHVEFEARAMAAWLDFKPLWTRVRAQVLERWSRG